MNNYAIYQYQAGDVVRKAINKHGWSKSMEMHPEVKINMDVQFSDGSEKFESWMSDYYKLVATVEATDLDDVFRAGNIQQQRLKIVGMMHSVSVGDVIEDMATGEFFMVDPEGFASVEFNVLEKV